MNCFTRECSSDISRLNRRFDASLVTETMGRLMDAFSACFGLGLAAGAGYYLYRKFASGKSEEDSTKNSALQVNSNNRDRVLGHGSLEEHL